MSKGKRYEKKKRIRFKRVILLAVQLILLIIIIYTGMQIYKWYKENQNNKEIIEEISDAIIVDEENGDIKIDFDKLKEKNSDTIAWIKVNGTDIKYPVVKTTNNDYYMTHSFDKSYNSVGWIFADYKNKFDGTDKNIVVYGHNRRDGSMFGTLKNILNENWYNNEENLKIKFVTEEEDYTFQVFSIYRIEKEDYYITTNFATNNEFQKFIDKIKSRSVKDFNVDVTTDDSILTLSTCADNNKYRVVLHAKKIVE